MALEHASSAPTHRRGSESGILRAPPAPLRPSSARHRAASAALAHRRSMSSVDDLAGPGEAQVSLHCAAVLAILSMHYPQACAGLSG